MTIILIGAVFVTAIIIFILFPINVDGPTKHNPLDNGSVHGEPQPVEAVHGVGFEFNAENQEYVEQPENATNESIHDGEYTLSLWVKIDDDSNQQYFIGDRQYKYSTPALYASESGNIEYRLHWSRHSLDYSVTLTGGEIQSETWYHVAVTSAVDNDTTTLELYVDGEKRDRITTTEDIDHSGDLDIARGEWNHDEMYLNGSVASVALYNESLSSDRIKSLYSWGDSQSHWRIIYLHDGVLELVIVIIAIIAAIAEVRVRI